MGFGDSTDRASAIPRELELRYNQSGSYTVFIYHFNRMIRNKFLWGSFAIVVSLLFAIDVDSCFGGGDRFAGGTAGKLNGKSVSNKQLDEARAVVRAEIRQQERQMQMYGMTPPKVSEDEVERRAWQQIAVSQTAAANKLSATQKQSVNLLLNSFRGQNGTFDPAVYGQFLQNSDLSQQFFENVFLPGFLERQKCESLVRTAQWASPMEMNDELYSYTDQFTVFVASMSNSFENADMKLADKDYEKYYQENTNSFALPDRIAVQYVAVPVTNYLSFVTVDEDDVSDYYDQHIDQYQRTVSNKTESIPLAEVRTNIVNELKMEAAAHCAATTLTAYVAMSGVNTNENLLKKLAGDLKLTVKDSPLFGKNEMLYFAENSSEFSSQAFDLDPESNLTRYGVVKGKKTVYLIDRTKEEKAHVQSYKEVADRVKRLAVEKARAEAFDKAAKEAKKSFEKSLASGKKFADCAKEQAMNVSTQITFAVQNLRSKTKFDNSYAVAYGALRTAVKGKVSDPVPASIDESAFQRFQFGMDELTRSLGGKALFVYVVDRKPGNVSSTEAREIRSAIEAKIARRNSGNLFSDWQKWNLTSKGFEPVRSFSMDDTAASGDDDSDID